LEKHDRYAHGWQDEVPTGKATVHAKIVFSCCNLLKENPFVEIVPPNLRMPSLREEGGEKIGGEKEKMNTKSKKATQRR
jgi:hypothetical protein